MPESLSCARSISNLTFSVFMQPFPWPASMFLQISDLALIILLGSLLSKTSLGNEQLVDVISVPTSILLRVQSHLSKTMAYHSKHPCLNIVPVGTQQGFSTAMRRETLLCRWRHSLEQRPSKTGSFSAGRFWPGDRLLSFNYIRDVTRILR